MADHSGIAAPLAEALATKGYSELTPVQAAVLDPALEGEDLLVSAQTGSGKTVAFGLALAPALLAGADRLAKPTSPLALVIAPTRELALQVERELSWLYAAAGGKITTCIGGMDMRDERRALERGVHIVVGTPGRLADHVKRRSLALEALQAVVLDEADEMLDMGFREELELILSAAPETRRTLMFSATVSKPIARLAESFQNNAVRVNTVSAREQHVDIEYQALTVAPNDVEHAVINILLFHDAQNAIVFCSRRDAVNKLTARLNNRGFSVVALSGEFTQKERTNSIQAMRDGRARVCVATDVAARGLDLPGLDLVIHADLPRNKEGLLHRSGRTGRAGRKGVSALVVPFRAKPRIQRLLRDAGVTPVWGTPPTVAEIEAQMDARLLAHPAFESPITDGEKPVAAALLAKFGPDQVAAAFVRLTRDRQSAPEDLQAIPADGGKKDRYDPDRRDNADQRERRGRVPDPDFENGSWVVLSVGRKTNADPKWLLPMLCKAGGFKRDQIGAIRIGPTLTHVELQPDAARILIDKAGPEGRIDKSLSINRAPGPPKADDFGDRPPRKPYKGKSGGKPFTKKPGGKAYRPRAESSGEDKPFRAKPGDKPYKGKAGAKPFKAKAGGKPGAKVKKPRWAADDPRRKAKPQRKKD